MISWLSLFLGNLVFVRLVGLEQFSKSLSFPEFLKKASLSFLLVGFLYTISFPLSNFLVNSSLPYLLPLVYSLLGYGLYWLVTFLKKNYDYKIIESPMQLKLDLFYGTLNAGIFFFIFSLNPTFPEGILVLLISFLSYALAYLLWIGIRNKIKTEIYENPSLRYWSYYFSLMLLSFFFCSLVLVDSFNL